MHARPCFAAVILAFAIQSAPVLSQDLSLEAMQDYMMFTEYEAGIIQPPQVDQTVFENAVFIDVRDAEQYAQEHIPGAINIEWRTVLERIDEIPEDGMVIVYCNTGTISSQAMFALRVAGRTNVVVLQTGINGWKEDGAYKP